MKVAAKKPKPKPKRREFPGKRPDCPFPGCTGGCAGCFNARQSKPKKPPREIRKGDFVSFEVHSNRPRVCGTVIAVDGDNLAVEAVLAPVPMSTWWLRQASGMAVERWPHSTRPELVIYRMLRDCATRLVPVA